ncbi:hypothetical protein GAR05_03880 [Micromonospora saelicesensis]|uniref:Uncharacterized protein n=1 Tax=Micromonospora saelicesensis TaxID=285676 RepID=A0ABX9CFZ5_9ACTN|nr:hypothetical protein [Micromonospora saelicesensis]RAN96817.1 hypothetical protein GAR05_03880 [Micromonospora saelicesensis]
MTAYDVAAKLPDIDLLRQRCKALAVLERIIDGGDPYYGYTSNWGTDEAALMSNGSGDEWTVVFTADGAFIRLFDHESAMSPYCHPDHELWPGLIDGVPEVLRPQVTEPAFCDEDGQLVATTVLWRLAGDDRWHAGNGIAFPPPSGPYDDNGPDGSGLLDILFDDIVDRFVEFAGDYYEMTVDRAAVEHVVAHRPLTDTVTRALNPQLTVADLRVDLTEIGYPIAGDGAATVEVGPHGAFSANSVGLDRAPFPLSFSVRETGGSWMVTATAAQAAELADVLMLAGNDTIMVVGLETNSFLDEEYQQWRPSRIAAEQGVSFEVHQVAALAAGVVGLSEEAVLIRREQLPRFLAGWYPYNLTLVDVPATPSAAQVDEMIVVIGAATYDEPVLPALAGSRLLFSGHDDCYVAVETTDRAVPAAVLGRLLALLVGSALVNTTVVEVTAPDVETVQRLIEESRHWIGELGTATPGWVTVDLHATSESWRLGQSVPKKVDRRMVYDVANRAWRLTEVVAPLPNQ